MDNDADDHKEKQARTRKIESVKAVKEEERVKSGCVMSSKSKQRLRNSRMEPVRTGLPVGGDDRSAQRMPVVTLLISKLDLDR